jgi:asparagine synthase (glutamine-hydrolysing)
VCGICGILTTDRTLVSRERLERMADTIRHRGPDDSGVWIGGSAGLTVGLAHRRLSIIDLSTAGHQPMTNEDGSIWLTYNGEIYNHADLRAELEPAGHEYRSHTDSETIIHAFEQWGAKAVDRFRGMFAFALWDNARRRLMLVRDRLGIKPLYYAETSDGLVFASEIKAILASGLVPTALADGALSEYLAFGYLAGEGTMFRGIRKLPPGHTLSWEDGRARVAPYWELRFVPAIRTPEPELVHTFSDLFQQSVKLRLMSDVPLGVFLSGGLDSSAIAAVTSCLISDPLKTFSVGFESRYYSEFSYARDVARLVGADHHEVVLTSDAFANALPRLVWHEDEPLWGTASVALYFVSELAARDVKVVLTCEGSDELFAGYDRYWMTALNARALRLYGLLPRAGRNLLRKGLFSDVVPERIRRAFSHTFLHADTIPESLILDNWFGLFSPEWQRQLAGPALARDLDTADVYMSRRDVFDHAPAADIVDRFLYLDIKTSLVELLMKQDQMSMAASIESRVPFLDHKLVEFAATLPDRWKLDGWTTKRVLRESMKGLLPDSILNRPKMGFPVPFAHWTRGGWNVVAREVLLDRRSRERGLIDPQAVDRLLAHHATGRTEGGDRIWSLLNLELWYRTFIDQEGIQTLPHAHSVAEVGSAAAA